jgi:hypothetical protein
VLKQCYKHKRGIPGILGGDPSAQHYQLCIPTPSQLSIVDPPTQQQSGLQESSSTSTTTLPPLEAEFLAEMEVNPVTAGMSMVGDGIDWDALMNDGELWKNIAGGWNEAGGDDGLGS